jgi:hypothetical protein
MVTLTSLGSSKVCFSFIGYPQIGRNDVYPTNISISGGEFNALVSMKILNKAKKTDIQAQAKVALTAGTVDITADANVGIARSNIETNTETTIQVSWSGMFFSDCSYLPLALPDPESSLKLILMPLHRWWSYQTNGAAVGHSESHECRRPLP